MLPKNLVLDEEAAPKDFDEAIDLIRTKFRVQHERTSLERLTLRPDGILVTPAGDFLLTRSFLESGAKLIEMPQSYAYKVTPELFCENFNQRRSEATLPVTVCTIGDVAVGMVNDRRRRYRPANICNVLRWLSEQSDWELRRASLSFYGMNLEMIRPGEVIEPEVGDVVELGIAITSSETGFGQLKASAYSHRIVCSNGAVMVDDLGSARWPNDARMTEAGCMRDFQRNVTGLIEQLDAVKKLYQSPMVRMMSDDESWNLWRRLAYHLDSQEADAVLGWTESSRRELQQRIRSRDLVESPQLAEMDVYELHNQITHAAHGRPFRMRQSLQALGGDLLHRAFTWPFPVSLN